MASTNTKNVIDGDLIFIEKLSKHHKFTKTERNLLVDLTKNGIVAVETLLEETISLVGRIRRSNTPGEDFIDGSDAKKGIVTLNDAKTGSRAATIGNVKNKRGVLRICIADPLTKELYYFLIPNSEIGHKTHLKIFFDKDGGMPKKMTKISGPNSFSSRAWLEYRVDSFYEFCD